MRAPTSYSLYDGRQQKLTVLLPPVTVEEVGCKAGKPGRFLGD